MTDRQHLRRDGPLSQRIVLAALLYGSGVMALGTVAWLVGLWTIGHIVVGAASGVASVMVVAALFVERRERRRERPESS